MVWLFVFKYIGQTAARAINTALMLTAQAAKRDTANVRSLSASNIPD